MIRAHRVCTVQNQEPHPSHPTSAQPLDDSLVLKTPQFITLLTEVGAASLVLRGAVCWVMLVTL